MPDFNNGLGNDFSSEVSKQLDFAWVRCTCTKQSGDLHDGVISLT